MINNNSSSNNNDNTNNNDNNNTNNSNNKNIKTPKLMDKRTCAKLGYRKTGVKLAKRAIMRLN